MYGADEHGSGGSMRAVGKQVTCPMCGGIVEADDADILVELARKHTVAAHGYDVPAGHVLASMQDADEVI
jgi:pyochelin biosynthesis protein PchC